MGSPRRSPTKKRAFGRSRTRTPSKAGTITSRRTVFHWRSTGCFSGEIPGIRQPGREPILPDVQSDFVGHLKSRVVVPLYREDTVPQPVKRLHPVFTIGDAR